ncbi:MAG: hypothetical protein ONB05_04145 [candidate division KSB1 bacterium]|nr:hypothetical protein [candidate division KSB1 bacterium]
MVVAGAAEAGALVVAAGAEVAGAWVVVAGAAQAINTETTKTRT